MPWKSIGIELKICFTTLREFEIETAEVKLGSHLWIPTKEYTLHLFSEQFFPLLGLCIRTEDSLTEYRKFPQKQKNFQLKEF